MLDLPLAQTNTNILKMIPINANINFGNLNHDIVDVNISKYYI